MSQLRDDLLDHAGRFQKRHNYGIRTESRDAAAASIDRLVDWSAANANELSVRGPEGSDPVFGVVPYNGIASVWRIYPRSEGGKVTLLSKAEHLLTRDERRSIVTVLERIQPGTRVGAVQRLEVGLPRIASDANWNDFAPLLDLSLQVAKRHPSSCSDAQEPAD